jgi:biopolymer transport protein ExbB/TolQ
VIQFACTCGRSYEVEPERAGRKVVCLSCGAELQVPELATATATRFTEPALERTDASAARAESAPFGSRFSGPAGGNGASADPARESGAFAPAETARRPGPSASEGGFAGLLALIAGVGASVAVGLLSPAGSSLSRMFSPKHVESVIPTAIVALFFWGVARCLVRRRHVAEIAHGFDLRELSAIASSVRRDGLARAFSRVDVAPDPASMQGRIRALLEQWHAAPGLQNADVVTQQRAAQDAEDLEGAYGTGKLVVWALPVLGLIGTVIGISLAVGGFAQFLGGGIDDVAEIKKNLVSVTGGLSFAFLITLIGLATSLVLMFLVSSLQRRESRLLARMQQSIAESLLPALQEAAPAEAHGRHAADEPTLRAWQQAAAETTRTVMAAVQATSKEILQSMGDHLRAQAEQARKTWESAAQKLETLGLSERDRITEAARNATSVLQSTSAQVLQAIGDDLRANAERAKVAWDEASVRLGSLAQTEREQMTRLVHEHQAGIRELYERLAEARARESHEIATSSAMLGRLAESTQQASQAHHALLRAIESLAASGVVGQIASTSASFARAVEETRALGASYETLARNTQALSSLHQALQASTRELVDQRLSATLVGVRDSLASIVPILEAFRQPFVLKAVPAPPPDRPYVAPSSDRPFPPTASDRPYTLPPLDRPYPSGPGS